MSVLILFVILNTSLANVHRLKTRNEAPAHFEEKVTSLQYHGKTKSDKTFNIV